MLMVYAEGMYIVLSAYIYNNNNNNTLYFLGAFLSLSETRKLYVLTGSSTQMLCNVDKNAIW